MTDAASKLLKDALVLPDRERAEIAAQLLASLHANESENAEEVEAAWAAEIERRCDELDSGKVATIPWEEVRRDLEDRHRRE